MTTTFESRERALFDHVGLRYRARRGKTARWLESGEGRPILYVHGGGGCGALWAPLVAAMASGAGGRHVMPDRPGFGLTPWVPVRDVDLRAHAVGFLNDLLNELELERVDLVANSMGALWSLWLASAEPSRVRSLTLLGTPALVGGTSAPFPLRLLGQPLVGRAMMALEPPSDAQVRRLWQRMGHRQPDAIPEVIHQLVIELERLPSYGVAWRDLLGRALTLGGGRDDVVFADAELAAIRAPMAIVWGEHDAFGSVADGRRIAATCGGTFEVVDSGHLPWLDHPEVCARVIAAQLGDPTGKARVQALAS